MRFLPTGGRTAVYLIVAWALAQTCGAAWRQDWTYDERFHLDWSRRLLDERITERRSLERFNSKTPATLVNVAAERAAGAFGLRQSSVLRLAARLPGVLWLLALFAALHGLTRAAFGPGAGLAVALAALDPNLIAHASLVTVDVPYAASVVLVSWAALVLRRDPRPTRAMVLGLALGLALLTKFSAVLLLGGLAFLPLAPTGAARLSWKRASALGALVAAAAWLLVCAGYLFVDFGRPLRDIALDAEPLARLKATMPGLVVPLPADFLTGIDRSLVAERAGWNVILLGALHPQGVWYYFPVLWLLKTPLSVMAAQLTGMIAAVRAGLIRRGAGAFLLANLLLHLAYFSFFFKAQIGYRFALMVIPLVCALAAAGIAAGLPRVRPRVAAIAMLAAALVEGIPYVGNPLAFTNTLVLPKRHAYRLVADSNLEWGQNRDKIEGWLQQRGIALSRLDPPHPLSGTNVFGVNHVAGVWDFERYRWLRENAVPAAHIGHSYLLFELDETLYGRLLDETRRLSPGMEADASCPAGAERVAPGSKVPFEVDGPADGSRAWLVCVTTTRGADLGLRGFRGGIVVEPLASAAVPRSETVLQDQVIWYRLDPGRHVFVARQMSNRRSWLPAPFRGEWHVRRRGAQVGIGEVRAADVPGRVSGR